jgi:hypothetical protein
VTPSLRQGASSAESWIVFETADGREKRRLLAYPERWAELDEPELHGLLASAGAVRPSRLSPEGGPQSEARRMHAESVSRAVLTDTTVAVGNTTTTVRAATPVSERVARSFRYPGGRLWSVCVVRRPAGGGPALLRFSAGARHLDLHEWPEDWPTYTDERLVHLVRSVPRAPQGDSRAATVHRRRHDDPRG